MTPKDIFKAMVATLQAWNGGGFGKSYWESPRGRALYAKIKAELEKEGLVTEPKV
jgi:hypothetical protein